MLPTIIVLAYLVVLVWLVTIYLPQFALLLFGLFGGTWLLEAYFLFKRASSELNRQN